MAPTQQTDVVIAGGGPVGLSAAVELGSRGVRCIVLEQNAGVLPLPKMNHVNTRSMEQCRRWGIARRVREAGWPPDHPLDAAYVTSLAGYEVQRFEQPSQRDRPLADYTPEGSQRCPQIWFDPILADHAASFPGVEVRFRNRFDAFEQTGDAVSVRATDLESGEPYAIEARYLVAADGAGGQVRRALGIERDQTGPSVDQFAITLRTKHLFDFHDKRRAAFFFVLDAGGGVRGVITPTDGEELWRFNWTVRRGEPTEGFDADAAVRRLAGRDFDYEILDVMPWTIRLTLAQRYLQGRVLLAGDAARTLSPTGGLGMNTGIGDAVDLGWKLAASLQGWGGPRLLESYDAERRGTGAQINAESLRNMVRFGTLQARDALDDAGEEGDVARAEAAEALVKGDFELEFKNDGLNMGYRYEDSPIVVPETVGDGPEAPQYDPNHYVQTSWPGSRAPHAWLADGRSMLDLFGPGFVLLRLGDSPPDAALLSDAARAQGVPFESVRIDDAAVAVLYERALVLVRPDGHVAWRGDTLPTEPADVIARIRGAA
ncbi:MAG: FAD-dependent monooxygenase [Deltaproteobacteria bacterium]|nr:FAD-dependent monooxygenase [Deltaproteobacteria bacterium]